MNIQEYIQNLSNGKADNMSVKKMKKVMGLLGNSQDKLKYIHVTGTNGKGSFIEMLNSILMKNGLRVGKFISPHLVCYNERISINGKNITDEDMQTIYQEIQQIMEKEHIEISFFEFFTIVALIYFYKEKVDIVLMEVGLGGLYDSTNIIQPMISVITSIGYDHMQVLGDTIQNIAKQKAGIIKENSETVYMAQKQEIDELIIQTCQEKQNTLHIIQKTEGFNHGYPKNDIETYNINLVEQEAFDTENRRKLNYNQRRNIAPLSSLTEKDNQMNYNTNRGVNNEKANSDNKRFRLVQDTLELTTTASIDQRRNSQNNSREKGLINNTENSNTRSFSVDSNAKRYDELLQTNYIEYFEKITEMSV